MKRSDFERKTFVVWTATCPECKAFIVQESSPAQQPGVQCPRCGIWFDFDEKASGGDSDD